jgi:hypothetical protein
MAFGSSSIMIATMDDEGSFIVIQGLETILQWGISFAEW